MTASTNDYFKKSGASTVTTLSAPGKAIGATSINVGSTTNYPSDTGIIIAIRVVDTNGDLVAGTYTEFSATVASGTSLAIVATPVYGSDQIYAAGSTTQVFIPVSSYAQNKLVDGLIAQHKQTGAHADTITTNTINENTATNGVTIDSLNIKDGKLNTNDSVVTANITNAAVTPAKLSLGSCSYTAVNGSAQTNATTTYADITSMSASITTTGGALLLNMSLPSYVSGGEFNGSLLINGVNYILVDTNASTAHGSDSGTLVITAGVVPAGTYTVKAQFKCSGGGNTATISAYNMRSFSVVEF